MLSSKAPNPNGAEKPKETKETKEEKASREAKEIEQAGELLTYVACALAHDAKWYFSQRSVDAKIALKKISYDQGYFTPTGGYERRGLFVQSVGKSVCIRRWKSVSPLQAAYLSGDGPFIGRMLLGFIINDDALSRDDKSLLMKEAREQLQELLERKGVATSENEFADSEEFLAPLKKLIKAYNAYLSKYNLLLSQYNLNTESIILMKESDIWYKEAIELCKLWREVGEWHRRSSPYVIQEFFNPIPFDPLPPFDTAPSRHYCEHGERYDPDKLGIIGKYGLSKGDRDWCKKDGMALMPIPAIDAKAMSHLYKLRVAHLRKTIDALQTFDSAFTFIMGRPPEGDTAVNVSASFDSKEKKENAAVSGDTIVVVASSTTDANARAFTPLRDTRSTAAAAVPNTVSVVPNAATSIGAEENERCVIS